MANINVSSRATGTSYSPRLGSATSVGASRLSGIQALNQSVRDASVVGLTTGAKSDLANSTTEVKSFATVAQDARVTLDAGYKSLDKADGSLNSKDEWYTLFGGMDRRALYAVSSNAGGKFSDTERDIAKSIMGDQQEAAMGGALLMRSDPTAASKASVRFLDGVSDEEKTSFDWAKQRAVSQWSYEAGMRAEGKQPENLDSGNLLVNLIKSAIERLSELNDPSNRLEDMPQYKQAEKVFAEQVATGDFSNPNLVDQLA